MYSTCTFCHAPLGKNDAIEHFPIGRRLAFDAAKGRLWAVCEVCRQWNLTPLEERWEAIEEAEKLFRATRLRTATEQVGLARVRDGTELIRIGTPLRAEFAGWRYGERFAARWRFTGRATAVAGAVGVATKFGAKYVVGFTSPIVLAYLGVNLVSAAIHRRATSMRLTLPGGESVRLTHAHVETAAVRRDPDAPDGWRLEFRHEPADSRLKIFRPTDPRVVLHGMDARVAAMRLLPRLNRAGGTRRNVREAIDLLERHGDPHAVMRFAGAFAPEVEENGFEVSDILKRKAPHDAPAPHAVIHAPAAVRLAAEMAIHEESERAMMAGELGALEDAWRDAEEVAAIADDLTLSPSLLRALERLKLR